MKPIEDKMKQVHKNIMDRAVKRKKNGKRERKKEHAESWPTIDLR